MSRATNGISPPPDGRNQASIPSSTRKAFETLLHVVKTISADPAINTIVRDMDLVPTLKDEIKQRNEREKTHEQARLKALDDYSIHRDQWKLEKQQLLDHIEVIQRDRDEKFEEVEKLTVTENHQLKRIEELNALAIKLKEDAEIGQKKNQGLIKAIEFERREKAESQNALEQSLASVSKLHTEKEQLQKECLQWKSQAEANRKDLQDMTELRVELKDDIQVIEKLDAMWLNATSIIYSTFSCNLVLSDPATKSFWARLESLGHWTKSLLVPPSNTDAGKQMRSVAILACIAHIFADRLFQPTYLLSENSGMRELLISQAQDHDHKEAAFRAQLQALLPKQQGQASSRRIDETCNAVMSVVEGLLPSGEGTEFRNSLRAIAEEACELWQQLCRNTDAVEPSFDLVNFNDWSWHELIFQAQRPSIVDQESREGPKGDQPALVVFPRLYAWYNGRSCPESHGVLFMKSHVKAAHEEMERLLASSQLERSQTFRERPPKQRRTSAGAGSSTKVSKGQTFLDPASSSTG